MTADATTLAPARAAGRGLFVVFEGGDGVGKSTQVKLLADWLTASGYSITLTFEPGHTVAGRQIRSIVLDPATGDLSPRAEALLYAAPRWPAATW